VVEKRVFPQSYGRMTKLIEVLQFGSGAPAPPAVGSARKVEPLRFGDWTYTLEK
jgi:hypothetical protein